MQAYDIVGVRVGGMVRHLECASDGPTSPIFAGEDNVENFLCDQCGELLIDLEINLMYYSHSDSCDCEECLEREAIVLAGGQPTRCAHCSTIFDAYAEDTIDSETGVYCSIDCYNAEEVIECAVA